MADQIQEIALTASDRTDAATKSANKNLQSTEAQAQRTVDAIGKANEAASQAVITVTDRTRKQIDATVAQVERKLNALKSPLERLEGQRTAALSKVAGDPDAIGRVTAAFDQLIAAEKEHAGLASKIGDIIRNPLKAAGDAVEGFTSGLGKAGLIAGGVVVGAGLLAQQLVGIAREGGAAANVIGDLSVQLGVSAGEVQILQTQARLAGVEVDSLIQVQQKLTQTLTDGGPAAQAAVRRLEDMGVRVNDTNGRFRNSIDVLRDFSLQINKFPDHASKVAALNDVFGKGAIQILPLIQDFAALEARARQLGPALDDDVVKRMADVDRWFKEAGLSWDRLKLKLSEKLIATVDFVTNNTGGLGSDLARARALEAGGLGLSGPNTKNGPAFEVGPVISSVSKTGERLRDESIAAGDKLVDQFRNRRDLAGLQRQLGQLQQEQAAAISKINKGTELDVQKAAIAEADKLGARIAQVNAQIKALQETDTTSKQAHELLLAAQVQEASGLARVYVERQKALEQFGKTKKAIEDINQAFDIQVGIQTRAIDRQKQLAASAAQTRQVEADRDAKLRAIDLAGAGQVTGRTDTDQLKANVPAESEKKLLEIRTAAVQQGAAAEIQVLDALRAKKLIDEKTYQASRQVVEADTLAKVVELNDQSQAAITAARQVAELRRAQITAETEKRTIEITRATAETRAGIEAQGLENQKTAALQQLDAVGAVTVAQKIQVEQARAAVDQEYERRALDLKVAAIERSSNLELAKLKETFDAKLITEATYIAQKTALEQGTEAKVDEIRAATLANIQQAGVSAQIKSAQIIRDHNREVFDDFKRQAEGVIDSTLRQGQGLFAAIGGAFKNAFLTAFKDVVATRSAAFLTELTTGQKVGLQNTNQGAGPLARILGRFGLGSTPIFGGGSAKLESPGHLGDLSLVNGAVPVVLVGGGGAPGLGGSGGGILGGLASLGGGQGEGGGGLLGALSGGGQGQGGILGALGGFGTGTTPPFLPGSGGVGAAGGASGGGLGQLLGLSGFKGALTQLGNLGAGQGMIAKGITGAKGGGMLLGGGILAYDGLRRGGLVGLGETTAGGALIGAKFGGPVGALIGGAIGFGAGLVRLFVKGKDQKIVDKVKQIHNIDITKDFARKNLQPIIDQQYGGNIELGLRSPEVFDLLNLYARTTGQPQMLKNQPVGIGLSLSGGQLYQTPGVVNGESLAYSGGVAKLQQNSGVSRVITGQTQAAVGQPAQVIVQSLQVMMNGQSVNKALAGAIVENPEAVGRAQLDAGARSVNRRELQVQQTNPGLLLQ